MREWLLSFYSHIGIQRSVLLLMDNFSAHLQGVELTPPPSNIRIQWLPTNTTNIYQPLDQGIIKYVEDSLPEEVATVYGSKIWGLSGSNQNNESLPYSTLDSTNLEVWSLEYYYLQLLSKEYNYPTNSESSFWSYTRSNSFIWASSTCWLYLGFYEYPELLESSRWEYNQSRWYRFG
jgi:DDE superfamily endonuclease.